MAITSNTRENNGVFIIDLNGRIALGDGSAELRDAIRNAVAAGHKKILLNLGGVSYIDSSGIGELVSGFTSARNRGADVRLCNVTNRVNDLLLVTKLYTVFDIKDNEEAAVRAF